MTVDLLLKDGIVILEGIEQVRSVAISGRLIQGIYNELEAPEARETIDCRGQYILPGIIDIHVHLRDLGQSEKENYLTGTQAAAAGGVTTVIDMPNSDPPVLSKEVLDDKINRAQSNRYVNVGFYAGIPKNINEFNKTIVPRILGLKVYPHHPLANGISFSYDRIIECSKLAKETNVPLLFHPDSADPSIIPEDRDGFFQLHSCTSEATSTQQFIRARTEIGNRLHVCHVSCATTMKLIASNRAEMSLTSEVTPHHLFLNSVESTHEDGTAKMLPPLRSPYDSQMLFQGLRTCVIDCVASDHAPHLEIEKRKPFLDAPSGIPGLETLASLLLTEVFNGHLTWVEYLRACSSGPALIVGLKNKGVLATGFDADIMIMRKHEYHIEGRRFLSKAKITPFEGHVVLARPETTIVEGQVVYSSGEFLVEPGVAGRVPLTKSVL